MSRVAPLALLGISCAALRLSRVAPLALLGIPYGALRLPGVNVEISGRTVKSVRSDDDQRFGIGIHE